MVGAEPSAGLSSSLPLARGSLWEVVPVTRMRSLQRAATVFGESPFGGSEDGDGVCPGAVCARTWPLPRDVCFRCLLEVCVRTWLAAAVCLFTWISLCVYLRVCG